MGAGGHRNVASVTKGWRKGYAKGMEELGFWDKLEDPEPAPRAPDLTDALQSQVKKGQLSRMLTGKGRRSTFLSEGF